MSIFAPPKYFAALAVAAENDADLARGTHVRLLPAPALGFPLAPVGLYRVHAQPTEPQILWHDGKGAVRPDGNLDAADGLLFADIAIPPENSPEATPIDVALEIAGFDGVATLLDVVAPADDDGTPQPREFCRVSRAPYVLAAPVVKRLRLQGRGTAVVTTWRVYPLRALEEIAHSEPVDLLSLPIDGARPWYAGGLGPASSLDRALLGAPLRLTPADRPDGPLDPLTPEHERQRLAPQTADLDRDCERMLGDAAQWPGNVRLVADALPAGQVKPHSADVSLQNLLLMQSMDPGVARYLGLMTRVDELPTPDERIAYVAVAIHAMQRPIGIFNITIGSIYDQLGDQPAFLASVISHHIDSVERRNGRAGEIGALMKEASARPFGAVRGVLAICGIAPPPDTPAIAAPSATPDRARWIAQPARTADGFRQEMTWTSAPLGGLIALGRLEDAGWQTRHGMAPLAPDADSPLRALPMLLGRTRERAPALPRALLSDAPIPADPDAPARSWRYRVALADLFGRFGAPVEFDIAPPPRLAPPQPAPQFSLVLDGPEGSEPDPASPGHLDISVPVPNIADLPAGALPLVRLRLAFDGTQTDDIALLPELLADPSAPRNVAVVTARIALPPLAIAATAVGKLDATFEDQAGRVSETATLAIGYGDRRPHPVIRAGLGLFWTSRPGPSPEVELKLRWPAPTGRRFRVFIADAIGLGLGAGFGVPVGGAGGGGDAGGAGGAGASLAPRSDQAVVAGQRARDGTLGARDRFRLLTEIEAVADSAVLDERLPRSLATVQVLRIVPLTAQGREAPFDACPVVPVAVPGERRPPAPSLSARIDPDTGRARLRIEVAGFDWIALQAAEPGLFTDPPAPDAHAPEFRLRRATGPVPEPIYARPAQRGTLTIERAGDSWRAVADIDEPMELVPFVRTAWWAEVRLGAERRVSAGFEELPPEGGAAPLSAMQTQDLPQPWSQPSAPATAMRIPPPPAAPEGAVVTLIEEGGMRRMNLRIPETPFAPAKVQPGWRLRIWEQWGELAMELAGEVALTGAAVDWDSAAKVIADAPLPATLIIAYIDPLERTIQSRQFVAAM